MNVISWNYQGLAVVSTVQELKNLCIRVKLALLFLMETRAKESEVDEICSRLKFDKMFCVEPNGLAGCLCLLWSKKLEVEVIQANRKTSYIPSTGLKTMGTVGTVLLSMVTPVSMTGNLFGVDLVLFIVIRIPPGCVLVTLMKLLTRKERLAYILIVIKD